jgi:predicted AlkP superfamily phosphohydrolase/phosphomutase
MFGHTNNFRLIAVIAVAGLVTATGLFCFNASGAKGRVVILGFDGVEPTIVQTMIEAGELPNLAKLKAQGTFSPLATSIPPQSATAWSSFATCRTTGNHGIYDFYKRDPAEYEMGIGHGDFKHATINADGSLKERAYYKGNRQGTSFWKTADEQKARTKTFLVPFAYPADDLQAGCMLCGLGVPDLRGVTSTFISLSDAFTPQQVAERPSGGIRRLLQFAGDTASVMIPGARDTRVKRELYVEAPMVVTADRAAHKATIEIQGTKVTLGENEWTPWFEWTFNVTPKFQVKAISRIHVMEVGKQVRLYMTCLQFHPREPYAQFTTPDKFGAELADRYGLFKTIGWDFDTHALGQDAITEDAFLDDVRTTTDFIERMTLDEIDRGDFQMLISAWTGPDRVSHMFWRYRDPKHPSYTKEGAEKYGRAVENTYKQMDATVGKVLAKLKPDDLLMVLSDHGFHSFRKGFNVNTWLVRNGYLSVTGQPDAATATNMKDYLMGDGYDWTKSKAYAIGLGAIFLNLKGREGQGTVEPSDADALITELRDKLLQVADPETGEKIFSEIYTRDAFKGAANAGAPDLQLGFAEGYQNSKATGRGAAPKELFVTNTDKWSGDHASSDVKTTPGIFFSSKPVNGAPTIVDLGVTALNYLGLKVPADYEGKDLLSSPASSSVK